MFQNACGERGSASCFSCAERNPTATRWARRVEVDGQVKWVVAGSAYLSQHTKRLHFGLGDRQRAEKVRIVWPSGHAQELPPLEAGFLYEVTEGVSEFRSTPPAAA